MNTKFSFDFPCYECMMLSICKIETNYIVLDHKKQKEEVSEYYIKFLKRNIKLYLLRKLIGKCSIFKEYLFPEKNILHLNQDKGCLTKKGYELLVRVNSTLTFYKICGIDKYTELDHYNFIYSLIMSTTCEY